jgi:hypothetical protein
MGIRLVVLATLLWVGYDFMNPTIPGAVVFNADECVDGVKKRPLPPEEQLVSPLLAGHWEQVEPQEARTPFGAPSAPGLDRPPPFSGWMVRRPRDTAPDPAAAEDH